MRRRPLQNLVCVVSVTLLFGVGAAQSWAAQPTQDDFARLDRSYIPALALTKMGTPEASAKTLQRLQGDWKQFAAKFRTAIPTDRQWMADCDRITEAINQAQERLDAGQQLEAHESLEAIREILMEARVRSKIEYYLDHMTRFHATMEEIVLTVKDKQPAELTPETIAQLQKLTKRATREWNQVKAAPFDSERFGFSKPKLSQRQELLQAETRALSELEKAVAANDRAGMIATGQAIKPLFAKSFMLFGDFPADSISQQGKR